MTGKEIVLAFWEAMGTNDFAKASEWLSKDFQGYWPQSSELIVGRNNFTAINAQYPANGKWVFHINDIVADRDRVVSDVEVTDGTLKARAITFHTIKDGLIQRQKEFWPDEYEAPAWRKAWVSITQQEPDSIS